MTDYIAHSESTVVNMIKVDYSFHSNKSLVN